MKNKILTGLTLVLFMLGALMVPMTGLAAAPVSAQNADVAPTLTGAVGPADQTLKYDIGDDRTLRFVIQEGSTAIVDNMLQIELMDVKYEEGGSENGGSFIISHSLLDNIPTEQFLFEGKSVTLVDYTVKVVRVGASSVLLEVSKDGYVQPRTVTVGLQFKATQGNSYIVENNMKIFVEEVYGSDNSAAASLQDTVVAKIQLIDYISNPAIMRPVQMPKTVTMGISDSAEYKNYKVTLVEASDDTIVLLVENKDGGTTTVYTANFNEAFKLEVNQEYIVGNTFKFTLDSVLPEEALGGPGQPIVTATISYNQPSTINKDRGANLKFLSEGETQMFDDYAITLLDTSDNGAAFMIQTPYSISPDEIHKVEFGQEFKAKVGWVFDVEKTFRITVREINNDPLTDEIPNAVIQVEYRGIATQIGPAYRNVRVYNSNYESIGSNYEVLMTDINEDRIALIVDKIRPKITASGNTLSVQSLSADSVTAKEVKFQPGSSDIAYVSDSGSADIDGNILEEGVDISIDDARVRVKTNTAKLETYLIQEDVTARTRATLSGNSKGIHVETDRGYVNLKVLPATASDKAFEVIGEKFYTLDLKELDSRIVYIGNAQKEFKILGFIPVKGKVTAAIDGETGQVSDVIWPWYSFMSTK